MVRQINKNLRFLCDNYQKKTGVILEGSSRSGKTISSIDFIIWLCANIETSAIINIVRDTYNSFKTTLYLDFDKRLKDFGIKSPFDDSKEVASFKLWGNQINFIGADKPSKFEGAGADYWYFNEMIDIDKIMFDLAEQRCRKFWWGDYNPKATKHWIYEAVLKRKDIGFLHSTFKDNPFISEIERNKILSYEPNDRNTELGTADVFMWNVYGLGIKTQREETIFKKWSIYETDPEGYDLKIYGLDFGYSNDPTACTQVIISGNNIFLKQIIYQRGLLNSDIAARLSFINDHYVVCDSAEPKSIDDLRLQGIPAIACVKGADSIRFGISKINSYKIHIHKDSSDLINEFNNYRYKVDSKTAEVLNEPVGGNDHGIDSIRYAVTLYMI